MIFPPQKSSGKFLHYRLAELLQEIQCRQDLFENILIGEI